MRRPEQQRVDATAERPCQELGAELTGECQMALLQGREAQISQIEQGGHDEVAGLYHSRLRCDTRVVRRVVPSAGGDDGRRDSSQAVKYCRLAHVAQMNNQIDAAEGIEHRVRQVARARGVTVRVREHADAGGRAELRQRYGACHAVSVALPCLTPLLESCEFRRARRRNLAGGIPTTRRNSAEKDPRLSKPTSRQISLTD